MSDQTDQLPSAGETPTTPNPTHYVFCPNCNKRIEMVPVVAAAVGIRCPRCQTGFVPDKVFPLLSSAPRFSHVPLPSEMERLRARASEVITVAWLAGIIGIIAAVVAGLGMVNDDPRTSHDAILISGGCFSLAIVLVFLAQLLHIRAGLETIAGDKKSG